MAQNLTDRREFLKSSLIAMTAFPVLAGCKVSTLAQKSETKLALIKRNANTSASVNWCGAIDAPDEVTWRSALTKRSDRDLPMIISGTVYRNDGKTPAPDILIYYYHTDSEGYYGRPGDKFRHGHFRGWMLTDSRGRYEFQSIKPAAYPDRTFAAHVHMTVTSIDRKEDWIDSILFEGDRFLTEKERIPQRGGFSPVVDLEKGHDGILRATRNIQLI